MKNPNSSINNPNNNLINYPISIYIYILILPSPPDSPLGQRRWAALGVAFCALRRVADSLRPAGGAPGPWGELYGRRGCCGNHEKIMGKRTLNHEKYGGTWKH